MMQPGIMYTQETNVKGVDGLFVCFMHKDVFMVLYVGNMKDGQIGPRTQWHSSDILHAWSVDSSADDILRNRHPMEPFEPSRLTSPQLHQVVSTVFEDLK